MQPWGGVEGGGTKFVCAVGSGPDDVRDVARFDTTSPADTLDRVVAFFRGHADVVAVGVACFGPLDPEPSSPTYGHITTTPKAGWAHTDVAGAIGQALGVPVGFDTDVNAAALGERRWGAARGLDTFLYLTVGTGIGGGGMVNGQSMHGLVHPEMGHIPLPRDIARDPFEGTCPYHGDCLEGLASGPAIEARWGQRAEELPVYHDAWTLEAEYLSQALVSYICTLSPQRIIMGGGVMDQKQLFPLIRRRVGELLNGYVAHPSILDDIDAYIVPPGLGDRSGVLGALALAERAANAQ
ncbi:MAG: ROK family protein [Candidatus Poribacteria bacterium]